MTDRLAICFFAVAFGSAVAFGASGPERPGPAHMQPAGAHPPVRFARYLAESGTGQSFRTRIAIANPGSRVATVLLTFTRSEGAPIKQRLVLAPFSRITVNPELISGLETTEFSTIIESDEEVVVDRATSKGGAEYATHAESSVATPSTTWFMAGGTTLAGSNLFYVIHNPGATAADVEVRYLLQAPRVSVSKTYRVAPSSRFTIWVNAEAQADPALAVLSSVDVSAAITSTTPVIAERAMYIDRDGQSFAVGHGSPGITTTATSWFFAEGATGPFFDLFLTLVNPAVAAAHVEAVYTLPSGEIVRKPHVIPANRRLSIWVDREDARLADTAVSATVRSTNGVAFVAERSMRWPGRGASAPQEQHNSAGTPAPAERWGIAEGEVGGAGDTDTVLTVVNTSLMPGLANITLVFEDGTTLAEAVDLPAGGRSRLSVADDFPSASGRRFGVVVESAGEPTGKLLVEWAMYARAGGPAWLPATNALATPLTTARSVASTSVRSTVNTLAGSGLAARARTASTEQTSGADAPSDPPTTPASSSPGAATLNLKVVTDASPDLTDLPSFVGSMTSQWSTSREKVWALFYWSHILKRQTAPMVLHGFEVTDPIRNFTDYGFTMCSTVTGINQSLYEAIGLQHEYWDICNHTVSAVQYDGRFHMIDSSMSNLVTNDDGVTLASVQEAAADSARLVRQRSLYSTSPSGFLTGTDAMRNVADIVNPDDGSIVAGFAANFCATGLKYRDYYYNWDTGHRYVLNLREDETYTRYYQQLGSTSDYWVGSEKIASPNPAVTFEVDSANRFGLRGNGRWTFTPKLTPDAWMRAAYRSSNIVPDGAGGLRADVAGQTSEVVYKIQAANAITSQSVDAQFSRTDSLASAAVSVSVNHGATWAEVGTLGPAVGAGVPLTIRLRNEVSGAYETLIRIRMVADSATPDGIALTGLTIGTLTQVNIKALPRLNLGRNEVFVTLGDQSDTMVLWPDLRADLWKRDVYDSKNIATQAAAVTRKYTAVAYPAVLTQDAYLTYRIEAPADITRFVYGGRLHNYKPGSYIDFLHSVDGGITWIRSYRLSDVSKPYDVIHYETVTNIPAGVRSVLFKYFIHNTNGDATRASGLYAARMEVNHLPPGDTPAPVDVTLRWKEVRSDRTTVSRSHRQRVSEFPIRYVVNVGGSDHPVMESMTLNVEQAGDATPFGYSDGTDAGGGKYVYTKQTVGTNLAKGMPYTFSRAPSGFQSSAPVTNATILTDGVVGSPATGGLSYWLGQCWTSGQNVDLRVDLGSPRTAGAFRAHLFGYPSWDALKGQVQDRVEVLTSLDAVTFTSQGLLQTSLWRKDVPINYMLPDDEKASAWNFELTLAAPVVARYVTYHVTPKRNLCASELQVLDRIAYEPFDIRIAPPAPFLAPPETLPNLPPTVSMTSPIDGAGFTAPATVTLTADAADSDDAVTRVEFFSGAASLGSSSTAPYGVTWPDAPAGQYSLTAVATDGRGARTTSSPVLITIGNAGDVAVPGVVGLTESAGTTAIVNAGLTVGTISSADSADIAAGNVMTQNPVAGATVIPGSAVSLVVSLGSANVNVPDLVGQPQASASAALTLAGLTAGPVTTANSATVAAGNVVSQTPAANTSVGAGTSVALVVSLGPLGEPEGVPAPWLTQDIGVVGLSGAASFVAGTGTYAVTGAGADIWGPSDAFRYVYQPLTGDGQIVARVVSVQNTNAWAKAGVMMRVATTASAAQAMMMVTPGKGNNFQRRPVAGGASAGTAGSIVAAPYWVKLTRGGNTITAYESANGTTWSIVGTATIAMPSTIFVGLAVSSHSTTVRAIGTFDQVSIGPIPPVAGDVAVPDVIGLAQAAATTAINVAGLAIGTVTSANSATVAVGNVITQNPAAGSNVASGSTVTLLVSTGPSGGTGTGLPGPWLEQDVGAVGLAGSAAFYSGTGTYSVTGAGADIWGAADALHYVYRPLTGDGQIVARVASVQNTNAWVKAGVMIRADLTAGSPQAMMMVTPGKNNNFQRRLVAGGVSEGTTGAAVKAPYWVKLTRSGTTVTAYQSADGLAWSLVGTVTVALPADVLIGLAVSSHSPSIRATATFDQVAIAP